MKDFSKIMQPAKRGSVFSLYDEGYIVWCGTMTRGDDGLYYLYFSFWPRNKGFDAWVTHSKIGYATSESPLGPFKYGGIILTGAGGDEWDRDCVHNPSVIKHDGKYYLYYMGNHGNGEFWNNRNNQRVGVAWSNSPKGPFNRFDKPLIDVTPGSHDSVVTSNPSVAVAPDGKFYMIYKAVGDKFPMPYAGPVVCAMAVADSPLGPFTKMPNPIMVNPEASWSVEDPYIWHGGDKFYALVKDYHGYFTGSEKGGCVALFESDNAIDWRPAEHAFAFGRQIEWEDGEVQLLRNMERPQLYLDENGKPRVLMCACCDQQNEAMDESFNVQIGLNPEEE